MRIKALVLHSLVCFSLFAYPASGISRHEDQAQEQAQSLRSALLAGDWLINTQNKQALWDNEPFNGDFGRWVYEYRPGDGFWRGSVCWTMATGIMGLVTLYERTGMEIYSETAIRAGNYLKSLQVLDSRNRKTYGAMREMSQLDQFIFPRDGMTSTGGFLALYRLTGDPEYLERAKLYADWYLENALNPETGWPYWNYPLDKDGPGENDKRMGYFQGGGGIFLYHLYKVTGDERYRKGLKHITDKFIEYFTENGGAWKIPGNNDDFSAITLLASYLEFKDKRYWDCVVNRLDQLMGMQREDGALVPGNTGGCYISGITALNMLEISKKENLELDKVKVREFIGRLAAFARTLQVTDITAGEKAYGGFWGQLNLAEFTRTWIHARGTTYSILFNLRYEGVVDVPYYSVYGWD